MTIPAIVDKRGVIALPAVIRMKHPETVVAVDEIDTSFAVERKDAELGVMQADHAVAVTQIFAFVARMTQVAIPAVPEIIRILAVLISGSDVVRDGRPAEKFP